MEELKLLGVEFGIIPIKQNEYKTAIILLFPYFCGKRKGNIALYARGEDYHTVIKRILAPACEKLIQKYNAKFDIYCDVSPFNEKALAQSAGLGIIGKNGLLINKKYGSFCFIGIIATTIQLEPCIAESGIKCSKCNKCMNACPTNALRDNDFSCCVSSITQKKGTLTNAQEQLLKRTGYAWGCDICQLACPLNNNINETFIPEFKENMIDFIEIGEMSNIEFKENFINRAFTWRGADVIRRNCECLKT